MNTDIANYQMKRMKDEVWLVMVMLNFYGSCALYNKTKSTKFEVVSVTTNKFKFAYHVAKNCIHASVKCQSLPNSVFECYRHNFLRLRNPSGSMLRVLVCELVVTMVSSANSARKEFKQNLNSK